ncbi:hypothetical protein [Olsenella sp. Marseille-P4559]|uniref:hypothetical protein n=1 Tax=Olsenella sp. Marseille-P4559 TaxID=2364795 RepID=UPI001F5F71FC|nr:hypothetical protein [Olsenella sp. Marseille-P4559]
MGDGFRCLCNHAASRNHVGWQIEQELRPKRGIGRVLDDERSEEKACGNDDVTLEGRRVLVAFVPVIRFGRPFPLGLCFTQCAGRLLLVVIVVVMAA